MKRGKMTRYVAPETSPGLHHRLADTIEQAHGAIDR